MQQLIDIIACSALSIRHDALVTDNVVGGLTECIGVGQRVAVRSVLCLDGDVTLTDLCLQAGVLVVHFLLRVVVG